MNLLQVALPSCFLLTATALTPSHLSVVSRAAPARGTFSSQGTVRSKYGRLSRLFNDPYEEQYRKYWSVGEDQQALHHAEPADDPSTAPQQQEPQSRYMPGGTQQYLQYLSSPELVNNGYYEPAATTLEPVTNPNPYTGQSTTDVSSYDLQYQQYLDEMRQQMLSETQVQTASAPPSETYSPESAPLHSSSDQQGQVSESEQQSSSPEEQAQKEQHTQDVEESFLRTLSSEVSYKKFLNQSPYSLTDINLPILLQRFLDNLEDSQQKRNGKLKGMNKRLQRDKPRDERKTVVVLGTGWASHAFIKLASTYDLRIVVVSPVNHFVFTPMLASAAVGTVEYRSMTEPIRVTNPSIDNYVEGRAIGVDIEAR